MPCLLMGHPSTWAAHALDDVEVQAQKEALGAASVSAAQNKLRDVPGGTAVVDAKSFEAGKAVSMKDMLDFVPGVFSQSRVNEESRLSIRGSGLSRTFHMRGIRLLQDGVPINLADGGADFQDIDPLALQHVEVYKGANALQYGAASLGGAINFVTPTGYTQASHVLRADVGPHEFGRLQFKTGDVVERWDYFASLSQLRSDGFREYSAQKNTRLNANLGLKLGARAETRFYLIHGDMNQELPGNLTKAQLNNNRSQANAASKLSRSQRDFVITRLANKNTWIGDDAEYNTGVYAVDKNLYHPLAFGLIDQATRETGVFGNRIAHGMAWGLPYQTTLGFNLVRGFTQARTFSPLNTPSSNLNNDDSQKAHNNELHGEARVNLSDTLQAIAGAQWTHAKRTLTDQFVANGNHGYERRYAHWSPKLGLLWDASAEVQVFGNLSKAYEPPTFSETSASRDLKAQESTTLEVGSRGHGGSVQWDVALYYSRVKNEFVNYQLNPAVPGPSAILNAENTIHQGIELGLGGPLFKGLFGPNDSLGWQMAYTLGRFAFDGDRVYGSNAIPGAPEEYLRARLDYKHPSGWLISPHAEYVPQGYAVDLQNTFFSDPYTLLGLTASYRVNPAVRMFVDARNLTNKVYAATTGVIINAAGNDTAQFAPGEGRSVYAGVELSF
ncbi:TonB-dependent receptor family protein [Limnobacter sp.]|uniref:TonB-dependent receptor family protein n=1 Tax=Limnobacter sp. TaxID=2003368 RepID=UPI0035163F84